MSGIQVVLLTGILFIGLYFIIRWRNRLLDIIVLSMMILGAVIFIIWPDITQLLAKKLGVGRGADLVFYISILIFWFVVLKLYIRIRKLEQAFTSFIQQNALKSARELPDTSVHNQKS